MADVARQSRGSDPPDGRAITDSAVTRKPAVPWPVILVLSFAAAASCGPRGPGEPPASIEAPRAEHGSPLRIVVLGDSLTAGLGVRTDEAFPAILERRLRDAGFAVAVANAGVSGDTSAGGLRRLDWALGSGADILVVALGANDGLRGLPVDQMKRNLAEIIERAGRRGAAVLLAGMEAPPNYGDEYTHAYREAFRALAREHAVAFVPFLLQGVAGVPGLNQPDGLHPTAAGARQIADNLRPELERMLASIPPHD